jgi:SSS family solute:Na+ symporter
MAWQGGHAFNSCAKNAHEAKMGAILGTWRSTTKGLFVTLLAVCAITFLKHPDFAGQASHVQEVLNKIADPQIQNQMRMPIAINYMLPVAIKGMLCSLMLFGLLACDSSYLHSWGSIFIQDIILPLKKKPLTPKGHINLLRCAIVGVAVFGFFFSLLFRQTEYILMFFALTGAIFLGGAGSAIAGGLYWKKGTAAGAWAAMISGSGLAVGAIILQQCWTTIHPWLLRLFPNVQFITDNAAKFPVNGQVMYFWAMLTAVVLYVTISLLTCKEDFNMERMLHRGKYAIADDKVKIEFAKRWSWSSIIGIDEHFTKSDKVVSTSVFAWTMFWWIVFIAVTLWNLFSPWSLSWWATYWHYYAIIIPLVIGIVTTVWFLWGGIVDLHELYHDLKTYKSDAADDGTVTLAQETVMPDNYVDFVESESDNQNEPKPYPGKPSRMD